MDLRAYRLIRQYFLPDPENLPREAFLDPASSTPYERALSLPVPKVIYPTSLVYFPSFVVLCSIRLLLCVRIFRGLKLTRGRVDMKE